MIEKQLRIIITGGHLFPGIALATALQKKYPGCEILFIGTQRRLDRKALAGFNFQQESIVCMGLKGMVKHRIKSLLSLPAVVLVMGDHKRLCLYGVDFDIFMSIGGMSLGGV